MACYCAHVRTVVTRGRLHLCGSSPEICLVLVCFCTLPGHCIGGSGWGEISVIVVWLVVTCHIVRAMFGLSSSDLYFSFIYASKNTVPGVLLS